MARRANITLSIWDGTYYQPVLWMINAAYSEEAEYLPAANPVQYGAEYGVAGMMEWQITAAHLVPISEDLGIVDTPHRLLRDALTSRSVVPVSLEFPGDEFRTGDAIISGISDASSMGQPIPQEIQIVGAGDPTGTPATYPPVDTGGGGGEPTAVSEYVVAEAYSPDALRVYSTADGSVLQTEPASAFPHPDPWFYRVCGDHVNNRVFIQDYGADYYGGVVRYDVDTATFTRIYDAPSTGITWRWMDYAPSTGTIWIFEYLNGDVYTMPADGSAAPTLQFNATDGNTLWRTDSNGYPEVEYMAVDEANGYLYLAGLQPQAPTDPFQFQIYRFSTTGGGYALLNTFGNSVALRDMKADRARGGVIIVGQMGTTYVASDGTTTQIDPDDGTIIPIDNAAVDAPIYPHLDRAEDGFVKMNRDGTEQTAWSGTGSTSLADVA